MKSLWKLAASLAIRSPVHSPTTFSRQFVRRLTQNSGQGGSYASTGRTHGNMGAKGSDVPWMIGSIAFTVPVAFYLLSGSSKSAHHPPADHGHAAKTATKSRVSDSASMPSKEVKESPSETTKQPDTTSSQEQSVEESVSNAPSQVREALGENREKASELYDEAKQKVELSAKEVTDNATAVKKNVSEAIRSKTDEYIGGKESEQDGPKDDGNKAEEAASKVNESESKGSVSKSKGVEGGSGETKSQVLERLNRQQSRKPSDIDRPAAGHKVPTSTNMQSGKQEGLSNQDTNHSILHSERGQAISKKTEGAHATAKLKGTVDPSRPAGYDAAKK